MINHNKIVWPMEVPPSCTAFWDNESWLKWMMKYRPKNYKGGATDKKAWNDYQEANRVKAFNKLTTYWAEG